MSVSFGKAKQAWVGKSALTKQLMNGAFGVSTSLDMNKLRDAAAHTCEQFPAKDCGFLLGRHKPVIQINSRLKQQVIAYGRISKTSQRVFPIDWELGLRPGVQGYQFMISVVHASLTSGKIDQVEEMEYFINELERNLGDLDPQAAISLVALDNPAAYKKTIF